MSDSASLLTLEALGEEWGAQKKFGDIEEVKGIMAVKKKKRRKVVFLIFRIKYLLKCNRCS